MSATKKISTGIKGLDNILKGGYTAEDAYLIRGGAGSGKTTLGLHFLAAGAKKGDSVLCITLSEPKNKIIRNAKQRGFLLDDIQFLDLSPNSDFLAQEQNYSLFPSSEVEGFPLFNKITTKVKELQPKRVLIDGLNQLRFLAADNYQFRKSIQSLLQLMADYQINPLLVSEVGSSPDDDLKFLCDGVINLGSKKGSRKITVSKNRGADFRSGEHAYSLNQRGMVIYPQLQTKYARGKQFTGEIKQLSSGVQAIDKLLHGGIEKGANTVITGPTGCGKTSLGLTFIKAAAQQQKKSVIYLFEESPQVLQSRSASINIPIRDMLAKDLLKIQFFDQFELTPEIFVHKVKQDVAGQDIDIVMIDSITSFITSFASKTTNKAELIKHLHLLRNFLTEREIALIMTNEIPNITGDLQITDENISYLADNVILLRYLELQGQLKKAIGVLKKRMSDFETHLRELEITSAGIKVGQPLKDLRGILTGNPELI